MTIKSSITLHLPKLTKKQLKEIERKIKNTPLGSTGKGRIAIFNENGIIEWHSY